MQLRGKIVTAVSAVAVLYGGIDYAVQRCIVFPQFVTLEHEEAMKDIDRCREAVNAELTALSIYCSDWSNWDDTYQYIVDHNDLYLRSNLQPESFESAEINLRFYYDPAGRLIWGKCYSLETMRETQLPEVEKMLREKGHDFLQHQSLEGAKQGFVLTSLGPMMLVSRPILTSHREGPARGTIVFGRLLTADRVRKLSTRTRVPLTMCVLGVDNPSPLGEAAISDFHDDQQVSLFPIDDRQLVGFAHFRDLTGKPLLQFQAEILREISRRGRNAVRFATWSLLAGGLSVLVLLIGLIQRIVVAPIASLTEHAVAIGASGDMWRKIDQISSDEVGLLTAEFNRMLDRLAESRRKMIDLSRQAGMAQVASGVLHNVGNVLASVNCSVDSLKQSIRTSKLNKLSQLAEMIQQHSAEPGRFVAEDPRGKQVLPYICQLATRWEEEGSQLAADVESLATSVQHINTIVEAQQKHATRVQVVEMTAVPSLLAEAAALCEQALSRHGVALSVASAENLPQVSLDRSRFLEVLVNLITNASESLTQAKQQEPFIRIVARRIDTGGVCIEVADNGGGIEPENLAKIFQEGFTTKPDGHGFGLHFSALAVREMGGTLQVTSEGVGRGACFTITFPVLSGKFDASATITAVAESTSVPADTALQSAT